MTSASSHSQPGCVRYEKTSTLLASGDGQARVDFELPPCAIPGSQKASITITGESQVHIGLKHTHHHLVTILYICHACLVLIGL